MNARQFARWLAECVRRKDGQEVAWDDVPEVHRARLAAIYVAEHGEELEPLCDTGGQYLYRRMLREIGKPDGQDENVAILFRKALADYGPARRLFEVEQESYLLDTCTLPALNIDQQLDARF